MTVTEAIQKVLDTTRLTLEEVNYCVFYDIADMDHLIAMDTKTGGSGDGPLAGHYRKLRALGAHWQIGFRPLDRRPHQIGKSIYLVLMDGSVVRAPAA